jgi:tRNA 2-thiocytidine biosynthesis protein TtcA
VGQAILEKRLAHEMGRCIADYELIEPGDRVMVAISGGKDSYTLLHLLERARRRAPVPFEIAKRIPEGQTYCSMCSRLRRGILYNVAESLDCTKIALGHHRDDAIETLMLNMMFNGSLSAMPAKLVSDDGRNTVIRPLLYSSEQDIAAYSGQLDFPIIPCNLCGSQQNLWRQQVKQMLDDIEKRAPKVRQSMLAALKNVHTSHLLGTG